MGSIVKKIKGGAKKLAKNIRKPISKITKGIARGIAKVGKSVMRGISRITKKLGPIGMIGLSIAMPYALSGLSSAIGTSMIGPHGQLIKTGLMAKDGFLGAVGNIGNSIRTGYQAATGAISGAFKPTGAIGKTWSSITKSISNTFQKFSGGKGNIWTRISNGAKRLYTSARDTVKQFMPKIRGAQTGSVQVYGDMGEVITMSAEEAQKRIIAGTLDASQLSGQTLGKVDAGWFTHGQSSAQISANDLISETINNGLKDQVNMLDGTAKRVFNDHIAHQQSIGSYINHEAALDATYNSGGITRNFATDFSQNPTSYGMDLSKNPDYSFVSGGPPNQPGSYQFTGGKTYNNAIGKSSIKKASNLKKGLKYAASNLGKGLLAQSPSTFKHPDIMYASTADMTQHTTGGYGGTDIEGAWGGSLLHGAFDDNQRERIMTFYKNMNIIGSH